MLFKNCFKCLKNKSLDNFYKHAQMLDGHLNKCKECTKADTIKNRLDKIDYYRSYDMARASAPHRKTMAVEVNDKWKAQFPNRRKAQNLLSSAVKLQKIQKLPCIVCGVEKTEAHHPDYDRPLDVIWMCPPHHKQTHAMAKKLKVA
jgi:hypothetical protein